ncbi:MAG: DsrE family protein [Peptococcales bacterium]|jgi:intracellular sulfur oxidation DsrE/DsrF family protein
MINLNTVFHISDNVNWPKTLKNVVNYLKDIGENVAQIEVVANVNAVKGYVEQDLIPEMEVLYNRGVKFIACNNALQANFVNKSNLPDFVEVVPAGITHLVIKQNEGYAYIKP